MNCVICKNGTRRPGEAVVTLIRGSMTLVVRRVPAEVCDTCGEEYVDATVAGRLSEVADETERAGVQVDVRDYVAA